MKKINIAVIGPIGVGKTTLINRIAKRLESESFNVHIVKEPSVAILPVNQLLSRLYTDVKRWAYPLQAAISASHEADFVDCELRDYDFAIFDMPYSSFLYCNVHCKNKRMTEKEKNDIINLSRPFKFDFLISLSSDEEVIIKRVTGRNQVVSGKSDDTAGDVSVDEEYLREHLSDFQEFKEPWIKRFFPKSKRFEIIVEDDRKAAYNSQLDFITEKLIEKRTEKIIKKFKDSRRRRNER